MWFDTFPTPQIACSLRQLNPLATNCLLVSTTANTNATVIGFVNGYVDIATINNYITTNGSCVVERWYNQNLSSSINSMANATSSQRPVINPSLYTENGYPCLFFDGVDDRLQMFTGSVFTSVTLPSQYTMLMTSRNRNATANAGFGMMFSAGSAGSNAGLLCTFQGVCYLGDTTQGTTQVQSTDDRKTFASFLGSRTSSTARKISINSVDETLTTLSYSVPTTIDAYGIYSAGIGLRFSSANTTELIYYDTDVQSFHSAMQANQQAAWGIT